MNDLSEICARVWSTDDVSIKKELLKSAVESFKYDNKKQTFLNKISNIIDGKIADKIAANLILNSTDKVVDLLPR